MSYLSPKEPSFVTVTVVEPESPGAILETFRYLVPSGLSKLMSSVPAAKEFPVFVSVSVKIANVPPLIMRPQALHRVVRHRLSFSYSLVNSSSSLLCIGD